MIMTAKRISGRNLRRGEGERDIGRKKTLGEKRIRNVNMNVNSDDEMVCMILFHLISPISF